MRTIALVEFGFSCLRVILQATGSGGILSNQIWNEYKPWLSFIEAIVIANWKRMSLENICFQAHKGVVANKIKDGKFWKSHKRGWGDGWKTESIFVS